MNLPVDVSVLPSAEDHVIARGPSHKRDGSNVSGETVHLSAGAPQDDDGVDQMGVGAVVQAAATT